MKHWRMFNDPSSLSWIPAALHTLSGLLFARLAYMSAAGEPTGREQRSDRLHGNPDGDRHNRALINIRDGKQRRERSPEIARGHSEREDALLILGRAEAEPIRCCGRHLEKQNPSSERATPRGADEIFVVNNHAEHEHEKRINACRFLDDCTLWIAQWASFPPIRSSGAAAA